MTRRPAVVSETVAVEGLRELMRDLRRLDRESAKELRLALKTAGSEAVDEIRRRMPARTGRMRSSVRALASAQGVTLKAGGRRAPYERWMDFGGVLKPSGRRRGYRRRPVVQGGRYVYPGVAAARARVTRRLERTLAEHVERIGGEG